MDDQHAHPDRASELAAQSERGRALIAAAVADTYASMDLRERVEAERERAARRQRRPQARRPLPRPRPQPQAAAAAAVPRRSRLRALLPLGGVVAIAVAAVIFIAGGDDAGGGRPSVTAVARVALHGPTDAAPEARGVVLDADVDGVAFPTWGRDYRWTASGRRSDDVGDRHTETVFYRSPTGTQLAYTIVAGRALRPPRTSKLLSVAGNPYRVSEHGSRRLVVWERQGHTCVISAPKRVSAGRLVLLAASDDFTTS
jgi:hypothetical protein